MNEILDETMRIIHDFFILKCANSDLVISKPADKGWYYLDEKTADKLKRQLIKYKMRKP